MTLKTFKEFKGFSRRVFEDMENISTEVPHGEVPNFFGKLLQSRDVAHLIHLNNGPYSTHIALNDYYDKIVDVIDKLVEDYQGLYGLVPISVPESVLEDPIIYFNDLFHYVRKCQSIFKDGHIIATIDEVLSLISSLLYKVKFLK